MGLLIYVTGFVIAYILIKRVHYLEGEKQTWGLVGFRILVSAAFSWVVVLIGLITWMADVTSKFNCKIKPPKWL